MKLPAPSAYASQARHAVRVTAAAAAAFALYHLAGLPQGYWAVFTAVIVVQTSVGATLNTAMERLVGTIVGAVVGGLAVWLRPKTPLGLGGAMAISVLLTSFGAATRSNLKVAPVTAVIMLISPSGVAMGPLETAILRVVEITVGSIVGVLATLLIFPARAGRIATTRIQRVLDDLAELIEGCIGRLEGQSVEFSGGAAKLRAGLAGVEAAVGEAARERATRLGDDQIPEAIVRTLWRLRNDAVLLARTTQDGLPEPAASHLRPAAMDLLRAEAAFARACAASQGTGAALERGPLVAAHTAFHTAVEAVRRERLTRDLTFEAIAPYFGLVFGAESLFGHLGDLADRIEEARERDPRRGRKTG